MLLPHGGTRLAGEQKHISSFVGSSRQRVVNNSSSGVLQG